MIRRLVLIVAVASLLGCPPPPEKKTEPAPAPAPSAAPAEPTAADQAKIKFDTLCASCHGASGKGDGAAAAALNPKPRDYTDAAWHASVTDEELAKVIVEGGAAVGKSATMPPSPDLKDKPEVVAEIVKIIRSFKPKQ
jgi:cytochrome c553